MVGQTERGANGTEHLQYVITLKHPQRLSALKKMAPRAHFEITNNVAASRNYCKKPDTRVAGPWEFGSVTTTTNKTSISVRDVLSMGETDLLELTPAQFNQALKARNAAPLIKPLPVLNHTEPPGTKGIWISGPPGAGKSFAVRYLFPDVYIKNQSKWWDLYFGQNTILIDDFDKTGLCLTHYLKIWTDAYPFYAEIKGGFTRCSYDYLFITSNYTIRQLFENSDQSLIDAISRRFIQLEITDRAN